MAATVNWNPNRFGSTIKVLQYNASTGNYSVADQDHSYTGVNYSFTALPAAGTTTGTTTTGTTTTGTTQTQTASAFGDVRPYYWQDEGGQDGGANVFQWNKKAEDPYAFEDRRALAARTFESEPEQPSKFKQTISDFGSAIKTKAKGLLDRPIPFVPGMTFLQAANKVLRPGANKSFRGIAGLYNTEINLMRRYGSVGVTDMNPTGDTRKDNAGFNIVSMSGNYNKIGTNSRRHNMLKGADIHEKGSKEWRDARNKIRKDFEEEKRTNTENKNYNIDSSGSTDQAPTKTTITPRHGPVPFHDGGGNQRSEPTGHGDAGKAGGESTSTLGSF